MGNSHHKFISSPTGENHSKNNSQKYANTDLQSNPSSIWRVCGYHQKQPRFCAPTKYGAAYGANLSLPWLVNSSANLVGNSGV